MAWECLQEELENEFEQLAWMPQETIARAFLRQKATRGVRNTGFRLITPRTQNKRSEGLAEVEDCLECGEEITRRAHAKFCTTRCKNRYHQRKWAQAHPEWRRPSRARPPAGSRTCLHCSKELPRYINGRKDGQLYCDSKCRGKYKYAHGGREKSLARAKRWREKRRAQPERKAA